MSSRVLVPVLVLCALLLSALPSALAHGHIGYNPKDPRNFTWVEEGVLGIGGGGLDEQEVDWLAERGFAAIVNFRAEHEDPEDHIRDKGMEYLYVPVDHSVDLNQTQIRTFLDWADRMEAEGRPIYMHCTHGWHRAAAFAVAWEMQRHSLTYDEAAAEAIERRAGTAMRSPAALLRFEADLRGEPGLTTLLLSPRSHPGHGGTMPVSVEVLADGRPAAGAEVVVWGEESEYRAEGVTGPDGRFEFTYEAPGDGFMDHLYARASLPGYLDGADNVELFFAQDPRERGEVKLEASLGDEGLHVRVVDEDGRISTRFVASAPSGWSAVAVSAHGQVLLPHPPAGEPVTVRADVWGGETSRTTIDVPPPPAGGREPEPTEAPPSDDETSEGGSGVDADAADGSTQVTTGAQLTPWTRVTAWMGAAMLGLMLAGSGFQVARRSRGDD